MEQHEYDGRKLEKLFELNVDLEDWQLHGRVQQQRLMRHTGNRNRDIGHNG